MIDKKIQSQIKIIEDFITLKTWIINSNFIQNNSTIKLSELILETNLKNKDNKCKLILSVNNKLGFIKQSEQFEDREVASNDTSNYKIVNKNDYAYNPARINVGSIARLINFDKGIVSPMYVCFKLDDSKITPAYFDMFLNSNIFKYEVRKKLEGSVRQCLTYSSLREIQMKLPSLNEQFDISKKIIAIDKKIKKESELLMLLKKQKEYLLNNLFI